MESVEATVRYNITTSVIDVFQKGEMWFVHFSGSWESLAIGFDKPDMKVGDRVHITFRRIDDAKP